jgi:hypothetical protein
MLFIGLFYYVFFLAVLPALEFVPVFGEPEVVD